MPSQQQAQRRPELTEARVGFLYSDLGCDRWLVYSIGGWQPQEVDKLIAVKKFRKHGPRYGQVMEEAHVIGWKLGFKELQSATGRMTQDAHWLSALRNTIYQNRETLDWSKVDAVIDDLPRILELGPDSIETPLGP